jgi:CRP-like cAMP-binding protein
MALSQAATADLLAGVPLFAHCSKKDLAAIAKLTQEVGLPEGHTVINEDTKVAYSFFVLVDGAAEVRQGNRLVGTLAAGDFFGEMALIMNRPRMATVTLTAPSRLLSISAHNFQPMLVRSPELQFKVLKAMADRLALITT